MAESLTIQLMLAEPSLVLIPAPAQEAQIKFSDVIAGRDGDYSVPEQIPGFDTDLISSYLKERTS